jgi:hypothetical protein
MGQLLDKLEQASRGVSQPLGFGRAAARDKIAPMLLVGIVDPGDEAQTKLVAECVIDAAIVLGAKPAKKADVDRTVKALKDTIVGVWQDKAQAKEPAGTDFQVFSSESTPIGALGGPDRTNVMQVVPELDDSLLRTIDYLPVDVFLVSLTDADSLTIRQLMRLGRIRGVTSRWLLAQISTLPSTDELEQLRDVGVSGIIVGLAGRTADELKALRDALLELPHDPPERKRGHSTVTLPSTAGLTQQREPEPDDDDDDWDDEP